ncbi:putative acetyl-CoA acetyltransferase OS=Streptomyces tendae OX=1932 GN=GUR47_02350 PE=3 SV=1 [Streptomyces tendae]
MTGLLAGLPTSVPGVTVNRLCATGLEAVNQAARAIALGDASIALAGGVESMATIPLGESAELIADKHKISREKQDEFALHSYQKAAAARAAGLFDSEIAPVSIPQRRGAPVVVVAAD